MQLSILIVSLIGLNSLASADENVNLLFGVKQQGLRRLEEVANLVSDPSSPSYGKYWTLEQVNDLTSNPEGAQLVVAWLQEKGFGSVSITDGHHYVRATAPVTAMQANFGSEWTLSSPTYVIPAGLAAFVDTIAYEGLRSNRPPNRILAQHPPYPGGNTTIALLNKLYGVDSNKVTNAKATQGTFAIGWSFDENDLTQFFKDNNMPTDQGNTTQKGAGRSFPFECKTSPNICLEASLDLQSMRGMANYAPTTFWNEDPNEEGYFYQWLVHMSADPSPPLAVSLSANLPEHSLTPMNAWDKKFDTEAQKLGVRGVTIIVASGDDGVGGYEARQNPKLCALTPASPSSSAWVTSVGATMGPEHPTGDRTEIACSSNTGGLITSGGGFSLRAPRPAYQDAAVASFLKTSTTLPPLTEFNSSHRGYPDIALLGHNYPTVVGGKYYQVSGTSASAPVFAGMVSLVNSARLDAGMPPLGFLNPALYKLAATPGVFNDITSGENNCCAALSDPICCPHGFTAQAGWDPVTGLGSINFPALKAGLMKMGLN